MRKTSAKTQGDIKAFSLEKRQAVNTAKDLCYPMAVEEISRILRRTRLATV